MSKNMTIKEFAETYGACYSSARRAIENYSTMSEACKHIPWDDLHWVLGCPRVTSEESVEAFALKTVDLCLEKKIISEEEHKMIKGFTLRWRKERDTASFDREVDEAKDLYEYGSPPYALLNGLYAGNSADLIDYFKDTLEEGGMEEDEARSHILKNIKLNFRWNEYRRERHEESHYVGEYE